MFYSKYVLAKTGPLGKIWLAAHWDKKLTKNHIQQTDITKTVGTIVEDYREGGKTNQPIALRTSGHLLLGVVKIYSRKTQYLYVDATEALSKIKNAFRTGSNKNNLNNPVANESSITLKEINNNFDFDIKKLLEETEMNSYDQLYTALEEDITLEQQNLSLEPIEQPRFSYMTNDDFDNLDEEFVVETKRTENEDSKVQNDSTKSPLESFSVPLEFDDIEENYQNDNNQIRENSSIDMNYPSEEYIESKRRDISNLELSRIGITESFGEMSKIGDVSSQTLRIENAIPVIRTIQKRTKTEIPFLNGHKRLCVDSVLEMNETQSEVHSIRKENPNFQLNMEVMFECSSVSMPYRIIQMYLNRREPLKNYKEKSKDFHSTRISEQELTENFSDNTLISLELPKETNELDVPFEDDGFDFISNPINENSITNLSLDDPFNQNKSFSNTSQVVSEALDLEASEFLFITDDSLKTAKMKEIVYKNVDKESKKLNFNSLIKTPTRHLAAVYFFEMLILAQHGEVDLIQQHPFENIIIGLP